MKTLKVFDVQQDTGPFDSTHYVNSEWMNNGNDSYFEWTVGEYTDAEDEYDIEAVDHAKIIDPWLIALDAVQNETVLIKHWW